MQSIEDAIKNLILQLPDYQQKLTHRILELGLINKGAKAMQSQIQNLNNEIQPQYKSLQVQQETATDAGDQQKMQRIQEEMKECLSELDDLKHKLTDFYTNEYEKCLK